MTFAELQTDFYESGFAYLNDNATGSTRAKRWINQAYLEACALENWPFLEQTATGTPPLTISDLARVLVVLDTTNDVKLEHATYEALTDTHPDPTLTGTVEYWYLTGSSTISVLSPDPAISLSVRYVRVPTELSTAADTPLLPTAFHDIIVLGAWRRGLLDDGGSSDIQLVKQEWAERVAAMRHALLDVPRAQALVFASEDW